MESTLELFLCIMYLKGNHNRKFSKDFHQKLYLNGVCNMIVHSESHFFNLSQSSWRGTLTSGTLAFTISMADDKLLQDNMFFHYFFTLLFSPEITVRASDSDCFKGGLQRYFFSKHYFKNTIQGSLIRGNMLWRSYPGTGRRAVYSPGRRRRAAVPLCAQWRRAASHFAVWRSCGRNPHRGRWEN